MTDLGLVELHAIGLGSAADLDLMAQIAEDTGGSSHYAASTDELYDIMREVAEDLRCAAVRPDTDGDGHDDGEEVLGGMTDPNDPADVPDLYHPGETLGSGTELALQGVIAGLIILALVLVALILMPRKKEPAPETNEEPVVQEDLSLSMDEDSLQ